ncbi:MAG: NAD(+)/NADH kinase [Clostridia bacterium]|nr:NAD(+)/NADH kinase [Clostridia bacterium]
MKNAIIIPNYLKEKSLEFSKKAKMLLEEKGYNPIILSENEAFDGKADFALVLGGDGTIIRASKQLYGTDIAVLGINFGNLGYLTECNPETAIDAINKLISGDYTIENRLMISGEIVREGKTIHSFIALNEASLYRATLMKAFKMEIYINNKHTNTVLGDGLIIATPTGSTSYNLSAGGPILTPTANNMVITQIAPFSFPGTPLVIAGDDVIEIRIKIDNITKKGNVSMEFDGSESVEIQDGDIIRIQKAEHNAKIIKVSDRSFYQLLKEKLSKANNEI